MSLSSLRRFLPRIRPATLCAGAVLTILLLAVLLGPMLGTADPARQSLLLRLKPPGFVSAGGTVFLMGSDDLGRDVLARILNGLRLSLGIAFASSGLAALIGITVGTVAGYARGWSETMVMSLGDILLSIPTLVLAIFVIAVIGPGTGALIGVLALARWPRHARLARTQTLRLAQLPFVEAARLCGSTPAQIIVRHILPNAAGPLLVLFSAEFGLMILFEAGLSFLGLGIQPPQPALGSIISAGRAYLDQAWWLTLLPSLVLVALVGALNVLTDAITLHLDPRQRWRPGINGPG